MEQYIQKEEDRDSLSLYFREKALVDPILEKSEEKALFIELRKTKDEERKREITEKLIHHGLRLVVLISKDYERFGLEREDLISEGNIGLQIAVERYDPTNVCKFSYYAGIWIRQKMTRALTNKSRTIRLPNRVVSLKIAMLKYKTKFSKKFSRSPEVEDYCAEFKVCERRVKEVLDCEFSSQSLNSFTVGKNGDKVELGHTLLDSSAFRADEVAMSKEKLELLVVFLNKLDNKEKDIISRRFGLDNHEPTTLEAIGKNYDVTRERIRQIEAQVIAKLKDMMSKEMKINA